MYCSWDTTQQKSFGWDRIRTCEAWANRFQVCPVNHSGTHPVSCVYTTSISWPSIIVRVEFYVYKSFKRRKTNKNGSLTLYTHVVQYSVSYSMMLVPTPATTQFLFFLWCTTLYLLLLVLSRTCKWMCLGDFAKCKTNLDQPVKRQFRIWNH